jgi:hypothetical protein
VDTVRLAQKVPVSSTGTASRSAELGLFTQLGGPMPRELIEPKKGDKRFVRRAKDGTFKESADVGKSLAADRRTKAKTVAKKGEGDKGDQKRSTKK